MKLLEALQGDGENGGVTGLDVDVADDAGNSAIRDDASARLARVVEESAHLLGATGKGDTLGEGRHAPTAQDDEVGEALSARMADADLGLGGDERVGWQPGGRHRGHHLIQRGVPRRSARAHLLRQDGGGRVRQRVADGGISPTILAPHGIPPGECARPGAPTVDERRGRSSRGEVCGEPSRVASEPRRSSFFGRFSLGYGLLEADFSSEFCGAV